jgi:hypothetical protein
MHLGPRAQCGRERDVCLAQLGRYGGDTRARGTAHAAAVRARGRSHRVPLHGGLALRARVDSAEPEHRLDERPDRLSRSSRLHPRGAPRPTRAPASSPRRSTCPPRSSTASTQWGLASARGCSGGPGSSACSIESTAPFSCGSIERARPTGKRPCTIRPAGTRAFTPAWTWRLWCGIPSTTCGIIESSCGPPDRVFNLTSAVREDGAARETARPMNRRALLQVIT